MAASPFSRSPNKASPPQLPSLKGYLYSPPEQISDTFMRDRSFDGKQPQPFPSVTEMQTKLPPLNLGPSPPASPATAAYGNFRATSDYLPHGDAPLYPGHHERSRSQAEIPLFDSPKSPALSTHTEGSGIPPLDGQIDESHRRYDQYPRAVLEPPLKTESANNFAEMYNIKSPQDAYGFWQDRMTELTKLRSISIHRPAHSSLDAYSKKQLQSLGKPASVAKPKPSPRVAKPRLAVSRPAATTQHTVVTSAAVPAAPPKRSPKSTTYQDFIDHAYPQQAPSKHKRAAPSKIVVGTTSKEDKDKWQDIEDYCPPTSTLDNSGKRLKVEWKHGPLAINDAQDAEHLHPQELEIAAHLRLYPRQYLANKRRIFKARLDQIKNPGTKGWNKTYAQQACNIDVNKASQLWEAFDRAGWFRESWFDKWL